MLPNDHTVLIRVIVGDDVFTHYIDKDEFVLGRSDDADVSLTLEGVSRKHLQLRIDDHRIYIKDLGSKYGTFLQGERIPSGEEVEYERSCQVFLSSPKAVFTFDIVSTFNNPEYMDWKEKDKLEFKDQIISALGKLKNQGSKESNEEFDFPIDRANNDRHPPQSLKKSNKRELTYAAKAVMLTTDIYKLNEIREGKKKKVSDLDAIISKTEAQISDLESKNESLEAQLNTLEENHKKGRAALENLKENFESAKGKYTNKIDEYKQVLLNFKAEYAGIHEKKEEAVAREKQAEIRLKELLSLQTESEKIIGELKE